MYADKNKIEPNERLTKNRNNKLLILFGATSW
jgi:hypothetical protein